MKKSYYNFLFPQENKKTVLYNARTGALAELDEAHAKQLAEYSGEELEQRNPNFVKALMQNGFAVEDDISELDMIRYDSLQARFSNRALGLTIAPTQACNFAWVLLL